VGGPGAKALGFEHGQLVERQPYDLLFGQRKAPDGSSLGRPPDGGRKIADLYARLLAAEPHATAEHELSWAVAALGPVPARPLDRLDWQKRAASIGSWRELSGYHHPADAIGPEPVAVAPDVRAAWHEVLAALGPSDGPDVRASLTDCSGTCATPTRSKPPGHRSGSAMSSARSAPPPGTPV
jgi:hypothetical protein